MKKLIAYFNNQITEEEQDQITKILISSHEEHELKNSWEQKLKQDYNIFPSKRNEAKHSFLTWRQAISAASIIILFAVGISYQYYIKKTEITLYDMTANLLEEHKEHVSIRKNWSEGSDESIELIRQKAIISYSYHDYKSAILSFEKLNELQSSNIEDCFYLGFSYLKNDQPKKAIPIFIKAIDLPPEVNFSDKDIIRWYLVLAYIKNNQLDLAEEELTAIVSERGLKNHQIAKDLLEKLKQRN